MTHFFHFLRRLALLGGGLLAILVAPRAVAQTKRVGINTATPDSTLTVKGGARFTRAVQINDYVLPAAAGQPGQFLQMPVTGGRLAWAEGLQFLPGQGLIVGGNPTPAPITVGNAASTNSSTFPFRGSYEDMRMVYLYRATALLAAGLTPGALTQLAFNVTTHGSTQPYQNFTIKVGTTAATAVSAYPAAGATTTVFSGAVTPQVGWNLYPFSQLIQWDGSSSLLVEVCFDNSSFTSNDRTQTETISYAGGYGTATDGASGCSMTQGSLLTQLPVVRLWQAGGYALPTQSGVAGQVLTQQVNGSVQFQNPQWTLAGATLTPTTPAVAVGIGTNTAARPLQVGSPTFGQSALVRLGAGNGVAQRQWDLGVQVNPANLGDVAGENYDFAVRDVVANATRLLIDWSTGNVGVGTGAPAQKLEVAGQVYSSAGGFRFPDNTVQTTAAADQTLSISGSTISLTNGGAVTVPGDNLGSHTATQAIGYTTNDADKLLLTAAFGANGPKLAHSVGWGFDYYAGPNNAAAGQHRFFTGTATGWTEKLRIAANGNVGIGITSPAATLHVGGAASSVRFEGLTGTGSRMVVASANGTLGTAALPASTASNGLTLAAGDIQLGGTLSQNTTVGAGGSKLMLFSDGPGVSGLDQSNPFANVTSTRATYAYGWQSFTAGRTGLLTQVEAGIWVNGSNPGTLTITILTGTGTVGTVLGSQTASFTGAGMLPFVFATPIPVVAGQVYTMSMHQNSGSFVGWERYLNNPYPGGQPDDIYTTDDHVFATYVTSSVVPAGLTLVGGRVGIGTTTPLKTLDVAGEAAFAGPVTFSGPTTLSGATTLGGNTAIGGNATVSGNLGVGTTTPRGKLDVAGGDTYLVANPETGSGQNAYLPGHLYLAPYNVGTNYAYVQARRPSNSGTLGLVLRTTDNGTVRDALTLEGNGVLKVPNLPFGDYKNLQWDQGTGQFYYDNSSRRFKTKIQPLHADFGALLGLTPVTYERAHTPGRKEVGFIAEQADSLGLTPLVEYDSLGQVDGFNYEKAITYVVGILQQERAARLQAEQRLTTLEASLTDERRRTADLEAALRTQATTIEARLRTLEAAGSRAQR